jgi:hypothetical protein
VKLGINPEISERKIPVGEMMDQIHAKSIQDPMIAVNNVSNLKIRDDAGCFSG